MTGIVKILGLLPILYAEYEEVKLITQLNNFFNFDHNIYLLDPSANKERFINGENTPRTLFVFKPGDEITVQIYIKNTFTVVVLGSGKYNKNKELLGTAWQFQNQNMKFGMFFTQPPSKEELEVIFNWCKENQIVDIFAAVYIQGPSNEQLLNIFTFNHFGPFEVINVTRGSETFERIFPSLKSNFQQHEHVVLDAPYAKYSDKELWHNVFLLMNATYRVKENTDELLYHKSERLVQGVDIIPQLYPTETFALRVYPFRIDHQVMIVPEALPYPQFAAYLRTVTSDKFFVFSILTITAIMLLLSVTRYVNEKKILFFQSVADVLNLLANDNGYIKYQRLSRVEFFLIVPLTFVGFIFVNGILSNLQSYLLRPVLQPQINTAEDLYKSKVFIATGDHRTNAMVFDTLRNLSPSHDDWGTRVELSQDNDTMEELRSFNRSISCALPLIEAKVILEAQKRLKKKVYRIPEIGMTLLILRHGVRDQFLFFERLNEIIHRMQSAGLYDLWVRIERDQLAAEFLNKSIKNDEGSANESEASPNLMFIVYGWIAGLIVFIVEIIWKKFKFSTVKKFSKIVTQKLGY